jgi:hypothetical protein
MIRLGRWRATAGVAVQQRLANLNETSQEGTGTGEVSALAIESVGGG